MASTTVLPSGLLQLFGGEIIAQFEQKNLLLPTTRVKTVSGGALSWQFPVINLGVAKYHIAGDNLITASGYADANDAMRGTARTIFADRLLTCSNLIDNLRNVLDSFDSRGEYAKQLGSALSLRMDQNIAQVLTQASTLQRDNATAATPSAPGADAVGAIAIDTADTAGAALVAGLFEAQSRLTQRNVPEEDRFCMIGPAQAKLMFAEAAAMSGGLEWGNTQFSSAAATGRIPMLAGFKIIVSNSIRNSATTGTLNQQTAALGVGSIANTNDYSVTIGGGYPWGGSTYTYPMLMALCYHQSAVGTVKVMDLAIETDRMVEYLADLVVAKLAVGHGVLRNESAVAILAA